MDTDAWGLSPQHPDTPADVELGLTADEDGDWGPRMPHPDNPYTPLRGAVMFSGSTAICWLVTRYWPRRRKHL